MAPEKSAEETERNEKRKAEQRAQLELKRMIESIPPSELFIKGPEASKYSKYDADGTPTHDSEGKELTKSAMKKLKKEQAKHKKAYDKAMARNAASS